MNNKKILIFVLFAFALITSSFAIVPLEYAWVQFQNNVTNQGYGAVNFSNITIGGGKAFFQTSNTQVWGTSMYFQEIGGDNNVGFINATLPPCNVATQQCGWSMIIWTNSTDTGGTNYFGDSSTNVHKIGYGNPATGDFNIYCDTTHSKNFLIPLNKWTQIGAFADAGTCYIYVNGTMVYSATGISGTTTGQRRLGSDFIGQGTDVIVADFRWYNGTNVTATNYSYITNYSSGVPFGTRCSLAGCPVAVTNNFTISATDLDFGNAISIFNATIQNGSTSTFYSTAGGQINTTMLVTSTVAYNITIQAVGYYPRNYTSYNVSLNGSLTAQLVNLRARLNITASSAVSTTVINTFTGFFTSLNSSDRFNVTTTNGTITSNGLWNETYSMSFDAPDYSTTNISTYTFRVATNLTNVSLYPENSIITTIKDEQTGALITQPITLNLFSSSYTNTYSSSNGSLIVSNLSTGTYRLDFSGANYTTRTYYITIAQDQYNLLNAWLLKTTAGNTTTFTIKNSQQDLIENVDMMFTRNINNTWVTVAQKNTGVTGTAQVFLQPATVYRIIVSASGYTTKTFDLEVTDSAYTIFLTNNASIAFTSFLGDITYSITPTANQLVPAASQNFSLITSSPSGIITNFGLLSNYSSTYYYQNISGSVAGGTATISVNTSGANRDTIFVSYFIKTSGGFLMINRSYYIYNLTPDNSSIQTVLTNAGSTIPALYKILLAIIISLVIGAGFYVLVGTVGSTFLAYFVFLIFGITGFISWIYPIVTGILVVLGYLVVGGNEGT